MVATISADIVRSTSLMTRDFIALRDDLRKFLDVFEHDYPGFWARIVKGDSIECFVPEYRESLRIALLIKLFLKMQVGRFECSHLLKRYGIRFSIGVAESNFSSKEEDLLNGPAIYISGRNLDMISREGIYSAFQIDGAPTSINSLIDSYIALLVNLIDSYSTKQAEVVLYKLMGLKEVDISNRLNIKQSSVNARSTSSRWRLLYSSIRDFEKIEF